MLILDTNVLSEIWKPIPDPTVEKWFGEVDLCIPVPVIAEVAHGIAIDPNPARRMKRDADLTDILTIAQEAGFARVQFAADRPAVKPAGTTAAP